MSPNIADAESDVLGNVLMLGYLDGLKSRLWTSSQGHGEHDLHMK